MSLLQTGKDVYELATKGATIEAQKKLLQLQEETLKLQEENLHLREENASLKQLSNDRERVKWNPPFYLIKEGSDDDGQYCQVCFDNNAKLIRLHDHKNGAYTCNVCDKTFTDESFSSVPVSAGRLLVSKGDWENW